MPWCIFRTVVCLYVSKHVYDAPYSCSYRGVRSGTVRGHCFFKCLCVYTYSTDSPLWASTRVAVMHVAMCISLSLGRGATMLDEF